jgi:hypothetical protein
MGIDKAQCTRCKLGEVSVSEEFKEESLDGVLQDLVNSPAHYTKGGIECIDAIQAALTEEEFRGYCKGNVIKYTWRSNFKGHVSECLKKASWYLTKLLSTT